MEATNPTAQFPAFNTALALAVVGDVTRLVFYFALGLVIVRSLGH